MATSRLGCASWIVSCICLRWSFSGSSRLFGLGFRHRICLRGGHGSYFGRPYDLSSLPRRLDATDRDMTDFDMTDLDMTDSDSTESTTLSGYLSVPSSLASSSSLPTSLSSALSSSPSSSPSNSNSGSAYVFVEDPCLDRGLLRIKGLASGFWEMCD